MAEAITIKASKRAETGSNAARRLLRDGWLPGVVKLKNGTVETLKLNRHDFEIMMNHHRSEHLMATLSLDGHAAPLTVFLREVQHHVMDGRPIHVDFGEISMTETMHVSIPISLKGEPRGVKNQGGVLEQQLYEVEVSCLPSDILETIEVDVSGLDIGDSLTVEALSLPGAFELLTDVESVVAIVSAPRMEEEPEAGEAAGSELEEPEVIGKEKEPAED